MLHLLQTLYLWHIIDKSQLPFCILGCRFTKYVAWNVLLIKLYYKTHLPRTFRNWSFVTSFDFLLLYNKHKCISGKLFLALWSHKGSNNSAQNRREKTWKTRSNCQDFFVLDFVTTHFLTTKYWCLLNILCEKDAVDPTDWTYPKSVPRNSNALIPLFNVEKA